jgi:hypothetical protein
MKPNFTETIPPLCARVRELCEVLRETRFELELLNVIPAAPAKLIELRLREGNSLYLLRTARGELVKELEAA